jgi:hypothetical protein
LPANTLTRPAAPSANVFGAGDTIRYHHFVDPQYKDEVYTGEVLHTKLSTVLGLMMYYVKPGVNAMNLRPCWITAHQIEGEATGVDLHAEMDAALKAAGDSYLAWETAFLNHAVAEVITHLSQVHTAADVAYLKAKNAYTATWRQPLPQSAPVTAVDAMAEAPAMEPAAPNLHKGVIASFNSQKGYGYIAAKEGSYYFNARNLKYLGMPVSARDEVTFRIQESTGENPGMPRAVDILVNGFVPAPRPAYDRTPLADEAKQTGEAGRRARTAQRQYRQQNADNNAASIARLLGRVAGGE